MDSNLISGILTICDALNKNKVQYMIVGGMAVALHGYFRKSINITGASAEKPDLDFWYNPTYQNYYNLLNALQDLGEDVKKFKNEKTPSPKKSFFKYEFKDFTLDLLPQLKAPLKFSQCYEKREMVKFNDIDIAFIDLENLIEDKKATSRPKDLSDLEHLKNNNNLIR